MKKVSSSAIFRDFYTENYIYVDKTEAIYNLLSNNKKIWIYDKWDEKTYPVLRIDFLHFAKDDITEFKRTFNLHLSQFAKRHQLYDYTEYNEPEVSLKNLLECYENRDEQIVLLFDEYDCQLSANINNTELYEKYRTLIQRIYAVLKYGRNWSYKAKGCLHLLCWL